jgi:Virulence factor membrane-bound polymerase, C-terminal/O-Antigen ligase
VELIPPGGRAVANLIQSNQLATLLGLSLVGALWLFETRRINGPVLGLCTSWLGLGLLAAGSRTTWLHVLLLAASWLWLHRRCAVRLGRIALACGVTAYVGALLSWGSVSRLADVTAPLSAAEHLQSGGGRIRIWRAVLDGLSESPWFGYGWSQVSRAAVVGSTHQYTGEAMLRNSHSLALDLLVWNGIPVGLLIIGAGVWWFVRQVRECRDAQHGLLLIAVAVIFVHGLLEYPLEYLYFLLTAGLLMGAADGWVSSSRTWHAPRAALLAPLVIMTGFTSWVAVEYLRIEEASRQGLMVMAGYARTAQPPDVVLLDGPREYIRLWKTEAHAGMPADELLWMRNTVERNPAPPALLRYALAMGLNGHPQEAADTLVRMCNMHKPERCDEGRKSWAHAQAQYPALVEILYPKTPTPP